MGKTFRDRYKWDVKIPRKRRGSAKNNNIKLTFEEDCQTNTIRQLLETWRHMVEKEQTGDDQ